MAKQPIDPYEPPEMAEVVTELPPPMRGGAGESIYDEIILLVAKNEGQWVAVDPMGRSPGAFRNGVGERLEKLDLTMSIAQRGKYMYMKYDGPGEEVADMIERVREESRAAYGE